MKQYQYFQHTLPNKLRVLHLPIPESPSVCISLIGKAGRRAELDTEIGSAHFLEHLFFNGTQKRPSAFELSSFTEKYGAQKNGHTTTETAQYYIKLLPDYTEIGFEYLADIFLHSLLIEVEKEKKIIAQEIKANKDDPKAKLHRLTRSSLYPNQAIGRTIFDDETNLPNMTREMLVSYFNRIYVSNNFILTIAGDIDKKTALSLAEKYFNEFPEGGEVLFKKTQIETKKIINIINHDLEQSKLSISFRGYPLGSSEEIFVNLLNTILGKGQSSRLVNRLRNELHLAYMLSSMVNFESDSGFLTIAVFINEDDVQKTVDEVFKVISKLIQEGINDEELEKAKNKLLSKTLFDLEDIIYYSSYFTNQWLFHRDIENIEDYNDKIKSATKEDLMRVANYIFSDAPKINLLTKTLRKIDLN